MVSIKGKVKTDYVKIGMPKEMIDEVKRIVEDEKWMGFVSIQEFVKDSVRKNIIELRGVSCERNCKKNTE